MEIDVSCPLDLKYKIVKALNDAISHDVALDCSRRDFPYYNQPWIIMWNHIGANLKEAITDDNVTIIIAKRGSWSFALIYLEIEKTVITIMSEERLQVLQRQYRNRPMHYLDALILRYNSDVEPLQFKMDIPEAIQCTEDDVDKVLSQICPQIKEQAERHLLITFDRKGDTLVSVKAKRLAAIDMSEVASEDWSSYIDVSYEAVAGTGKVVQASDQEIDVKLTTEGRNIKKEKGKRHLNGIIEPKQGKSEENITE